ncbi:DNA methyltransferase [Bifidobacterium myosotis]|uniref:Methyltransferase n=1 Tax=Bifidobacterium myosotis TaxID=1630166 RepID=A0A5M9ZHR2_9BIFI|nr:DNA methyltransferase [Bifidobacterium myosotis]KAA8826923.1 site-specific DNA-methyltransferase [Bifidobacterium myosotis]
MRPFIDFDGIRLYNMDARRLPDAAAPASLDAVVTDPPYELGLGTAGEVRRWDSTGIAFDPAFWASMLALAKPGAFAMVFGSPRTWHRLAVAMEDAGWLLRDQICWLYASGMPKGEWGDHAVDRALGRPDTRIGVRRDSASLERNVAYTEEYRPQTPEAVRWRGFNPSLKPAWEPILVAQRPRDAMLGRTLLEHGTGALDVASCALDADMGELARRYELNATAGTRATDPRGGDTYADRGTGRPRGPRIPGRHPSDVVLDADTARRLPDGTPRFYYCPKAADRPVARDAALLAPAARDAAWTAAAARLGLRDDADAYPADILDAPAAALCRPTGRRRIAHPTVKPSDLIRWLVRLACPPGGTVLDPFAGSGTTLQAARAEGRGCLASELDVNYLLLDRMRLDRADTGSLF